MLRSNAMFRSRERVVGREKERTVGHGGGRRRPWRRVAVNSGNNNDAGVAGRTAEIA
ncbi:hypothetical protein HanXRQr2_Chr01g0027631 [Helianthus annuus]|uniref:Uncharacterized protein n=1 Tax=Helianthus annuus TaxID=4232 RepID=A0A251VPZ4_HELAN|nr:hypothetical protein HanXRQr2_Chr01g0027631 [Helianthus annuus]